MTSAQRTLSGLIMLGLLNVTVPLGLAASTSLPSTPEGSVVTGSLQTRGSEDAAWTATEDSAKSHWFKTDAHSEAVLSFAGDVHMRMAPNTVVHVESSSDAGLSVDVPQGDVMTSVPWSGKTTVHMTTPNGQVNATEGSFIVKVENQKVALEVLEGSAKLAGDNVTSEQLPGVDMKEMVAEPGLVAQAEPDENGGGSDKKPDDPNENDDDAGDDGTTGAIIGGTAGTAGLIALLTRGTSDKATTFATGGPPIPGSP
ncbi:MAG: FecR domain-containing protein [Candidatus Eremiobacteraeota bacterium]|nr:FecR domain-containing protein [Candidatus Eremiobacteraeota bacterium]